MTALLVQTGSVFFREVLGFFRQRHRVLGALLSPLVFWVLLGSGMHSFAPALSMGVGALAYFFPGVLLMVILFSSVFSTISIIDDRHSGFLQGVLTSPASPLALVAGRVGGACAIGFIHALAVVPFAFLTEVRLSVFSFVMALVLLFLASWSLASVGFIMAWGMDSAQAYHAMMNILLLPAWFLSGAIFPMEGAAPVLQWVMRINPVAYAQWGLQQAMLPQLGVPASLEMCVLVSVLFAMLSFFGACALLLKRPSR